MVIHCRLLLAAIETPFPVVCYGNCDPLQRLVPTRINAVAQPNFPGSGPQPACPSLDCVEVCSVAVPLELPAFLFVSSLTYQK